MQEMFQLLAFNVNKYIREKSESITENDPSWMFDPSQALVFEKLASYEKKDETQMKLYL